MFQSIYYVPKRTGTLTDALLAYGLAVIVKELLRSGGGDDHLVRIEDKGTHYLVILPEPLREDWLEKGKLSIDMAWAIQRKKALPDGVPKLDYNATWDEINEERALRASQRSTRSADGGQAVQELAESFHMQRHRDVTLLIGDYKMQVEGIHNQAVIQWHTTVQAGYQAENLRAILRLFAGLEADTETIIKSWAAAVKLKGIKKYLTVSQVFHPSAGKGHNRERADKLLMDNLESFWLLEYLKAVALFTNTAPRAFKEEKMRKTYVLAPLNITLATHRTVFEDHFKPFFYGLGVSPVKADILASLQYTRAYLSYCREARRRGQGERELNPKNSVAGFYVAAYTLLSPNAYTMINLSFLGLPPWLNHIEALADVTAVQEVIEEHLQVIRPLEERFQEGNDLLRAYRNFLTGHQVDAFFDFCVGYGEYVVHTLPNSPRIRQIRVQSLQEMFRRIAMTEHTRPGQVQEIDPEDDLTEFGLETGKHPGFHWIAYAIRRSTVVPQRQNARYKSRESAEKSLYTVRYGLGQHLRRKATSARELMDALAEFVHEYNAETEQIYENTSEQRRGNLAQYAREHYRQSVRPGDLDDVLDLVRVYGPSLVCNMLIAYGYATTSKRQYDGSKAEGGDEQTPIGESQEAEREEMLS